MTQMKNSGSTSAPQRIFLWDNLKFVLIFLVVLGHFIHNYDDDSWITECLYTYICSFHMPAFLFVSGLFSKKAIKEKRYEKCFEYFVLYVFTKLCIFVSNIITEQDYSFSLLSEASVPWYAFALLAFFLITTLLQQVEPVYLFTCSIVLGCICGYDVTINDTFILSRILVFYPFFLAGFYLDRKKIETLVSKWGIKLMALAIHIVWLVYLWNSKKTRELWHPLVTGREHLDDIGNFYFWYRLLYYVIAFALILSIISLVPAAKTILSGMGSRSLQVYCLHRGLIYLFYDFFPPEDLLAYWGEAPLHIVLFVLSLLLTILLSVPALAPVLQWFIKPRWRKPSTSSQTSS